MLDKDYPSIKEKIVAWNPGTDKVELIDFPDRTKASKKFKRTGGGCFASVQKLGPKAVKVHVLAEAMTLIVRDKCDPMAVHRAFLGLREYRETCALDMPEYNGELLEDENRVDNAPLKRKW